MGALLLMLYKQPRAARRRGQPGADGFRGARARPRSTTTSPARFGVRLAEVYGMTEVPNAIENRMDAFRVGAAGRESTNFEVRVVDEQRPASCRRG